LVHVDGLAVPSCTTEVKEVAGKRITTIEGLSQRDDHPVLRAWLAEQVPQCGYCQPGMIMAAAALLAQIAQPDDADIDDAMSRVLCRCGTYQRVRRAVRRAAEQRWDDAPFPADRLSAPVPEPVGRSVQFNPWIKIAEDGTVTVTVSRSEMGQGVTTSLPMLVAEELEVSLDQVRTEFAPADHVYDNPIIGEQITVGSMSVQTAWGPLRRAGAEVRERLIAAAARTWGVARKQCRAQNGTVVHGPTGRRLGYGSHAKRRARQHRAACG
jgi:isoquinoline 1-oxidoreductase beta subunit